MEGSDHANEITCKDMDVNFINMDIGDNDPSEEITHSRIINLEALKLSGDKATEEIRKQLKTYFDTSGLQIESINQMADELTRRQAAQLFYQTCVMKTMDYVKVEQPVPYGDIIISKGSKIEEIINPIISMPLEEDGILLVDAAKMFKRKVDLLYDDVNRVLESQLYYQMIDDIEDLNFSSNTVTGDFPSSGNYEICGSSQRDYSSSIDHISSERLLGEGRVDEIQSNHFLPDKGKGRLDDSLLEDPTLIDEQLEAPSEVMNENDKESQHYYQMIDSIEDLNISPNTVTGDFSSFGNYEIGESSQRDYSSSIDHITSERTQCIFLTEDLEIPILLSLGGPANRELEREEPPCKRRKQNSISRNSLAGHGSAWEFGVRRSTRIREKPLEFWRQERFLYGRIHKSLATVIGVKKYETPPNGGNETVMKVVSYVSEEYADLVAQVALY